MASELRQRHCEAMILSSLEESRAVLVVGARQVGKTTLVGAVAKHFPNAKQTTLDDPNALAAATYDPQAFIEHNNLFVIDEIQRAPELLLPIKMQLDKNTHAGQYLLTGSAQVFALRNVPDTLPGRVDTIELWPFSQSEIDSSAGNIIHVLFSGDVQRLNVSRESREDIWGRILRGGFPDAVSRTPQSRARFFENYTVDTVLRNFDEIGHTRSSDHIVELLNILGEYNGKLLVLERLSQETRIPRTSLERYIELLELTFLIKRIPAWSNSATTRATSTKKLAFVDSGIAAHFSGMSAPIDPMRPESGRLVETFVLMELARLAQLFEPGTRLAHYRTRDGVEVDGVLSRRGGSSLLVEIKSSRKVDDADFRHIQHLKEKMKSKFASGIVFYFGDAVLQFGDRMWAIPITALWKN